MVAAFTQPGLSLDKIYNQISHCSSMCHHEAGQFFQMTTKMVRGRLSFLILPKERSAQEIHNEILISTCSLANQGLLLQNPYSEQVKNVPLSEEVDCKVIQLLCLQAKHDPDF